MSVDPLTAKYPWYTPYQFAGNKPIWAIDVDGLEEFIIHYKYENGRATQINKIDNKEIRVMGDPATGKFIFAVYDKRTGKPFDPAELGQIQYQYFNDEGARLSIRRDYEGNYVSGENEFLPLYEKNMYGSNYIGPDNPMYTGDDGKQKPDYRYEPLNELDEGAYYHDKGYDKKRAEGPVDAILNPKVLPEDWTLVNAASKVINKYKNGGIDSKTGQPVDKSTYQDALKVRAAFRLIGAFKTGVKLSEKAAEGASKVQN